MFSPEVLTNSLYEFTHTTQWPKLLMWSPMSAVADKPEIWPRGVESQRELGCWRWLIINQGSLSARWCLLGNFKIWKTSLTSEFCRSICSYSGWRGDTINRVQFIFPVVWASCYQSSPLDHVLNRMTLMLFTFLIPFSVGVVEFRPSSRRSSLLRSVPCPLPHLKYTYKLRVLVFSLEHGSDNRH